MILSFRHKATDLIVYRYDEIMVEIIVHHNNRWTKLLTAEQDSNYYAVRKFNGRSSLVLRFMRVYINKWEKHWNGK